VYEVKRRCEKTMADNYFTFRFGAVIIFALVRPIQKPVFTGKEKSIAILPFVNTSLSKENEYLSEGVTSEITRRLAGIPRSACRPGKSG
jgi:hypothetical protein